LGGGAWCHRRHGDCLRLWEVRTEEQWEADGSAVRSLKSGVVT